MPRMTIQQFRDRLAARTGQDSATQAYLELTRRPEVTRGMALREWAMWTPAAASQLAA